MRRLLFLLAAATLCGVTVGSAASLSVNAGGLGAARVAIPRCTSSGLSVIQGLSGTSVATVTVASVPSSCGGATLQLTYSNGSTQSSGSAAVPAGGGNVTVTLASAVAVSVSAQTDLVFVGP